MEHSSKQEFIDIYFDSMHESQLVDEFAIYAEDIDYDEFIGIIKDVYSEELDYWLDEKGNIDEDNFSFGDFINDVRVNLKNKLEKIGS